MSKWIGSGKGTLNPNRSHLKPLHQTSSVNTMPKIASGGGGGRITTIIASLELYLSALSESQVQFFQIHIEHLNKTLQSMTLKNVPKFKCACT